MNITDLDAVIFDNDGVLVNSEPLSCKAVAMVIDDEFGVNIGDDFSEVIGSSAEYTFNFYADKFGFTVEDLDHLKSKKQQLYFDIARDKLKSFPGCEETIKLFDNRGIKLAVASSGSLDKIQFSLEQVGYSNYFEVICSADEVAEGKPAPDLFKLATNMLNTLSDRCLVIEDSLKGVQAAKSAGTHVAALTSSFSKEELETIGADIVFDEYAELRKILK